jgi:hypothetical protein
MRSHAPDAISRRNCAAGKTTSGRKENRAARVAFSLPHDSSGELMFETCMNRRSALSAFRGVGFHVERRIAGAARRARLRRKRLNGRPNLRACTRTTWATPLKRFHRHGFPHQTTRCGAEKGR